MKPENAELMKNSQGNHAREQEVRSKHRLRLLAAVPLDCDA